MEPFIRLTGRMVALPARDVDTDQITPARFLKVTNKLGLGKVLFHDWRYDAEGKPRPEFPLNKPEAQGATVLVAGDNFGCGSSREHAPWALLGFGFRAIVSTSFADIFRNNCLKNGILPITVPRRVHEKLFRLAASQPASEVSVDLSTRTLALPEGETIEFPIDPFSRECLLEGVDELGYLLKFSDRIAAFESARAARQ